MIFVQSLTGAGFTQLRAVYLCVFLILSAQRKTILLMSGTFRRRFCTWKTKGVQTAVVTHKSENQKNLGDIVRKKRCGKRGTLNMVLHPLATTNGILILLHSDSTVIY